MITIEISSYPKSGNTWFRKLTSEYFKVLNGSYYHPLDIHEHPNLVTAKKESFFLKCINDDLFAYKSHVYNHPKIDPDKIIQIYRHPLDVFLSALNFFSYPRKDPKVNEKFSNMFKNRIPKSVDNIVKDNELDFYFNIFLENAGSNFWEGMLKEKSNYFNYVLSAMADNKTFTLKYEDLIEDTVGSVNSAFNNVLGINEFIDFDTTSVDSATKNSGNPFFWKAKSKNYLEYLSKDQISDFESKYKNEMIKLGYL